MDRDFSKCILLIVDDMPLRRAQAKAFLLDWATRRNLVIVDKNLSEAIEWSPQKPCRLIFLSIQSDEALHDKYSAAIRLFSAVHADVPLAVVADGMVNAELALASGATGYIPTSLQESVVLAALDFLLAGGSFFPKELFRRADSEPAEPRQGRLSAPALFNLASISRIEPPSSAPDGPPHIDRASAGSCSGNPADTGASHHDGEHASCRLTPRQAEVLGLLRRGQSNKHIARELDMSEATVKVHVRQVMKRLGATNRTQAAVMAFPAPEKEKQQQQPARRDREASIPMLKLAVAPSLVAAQ